jgi:hypothetical protein
MHLCDENTTHRGRGALAHGLGGECGPGIMGLEGDGASKCGAHGPLLKPKLVRAFALGRLVQPEPFCSCARG